MSLFICAHGELYSKCKYCYSFIEDNEEEENEEEELLSNIVNRIKKEKIEY